jgi:hypothetical protein
MRIDSSGNILFGATGTATTSYGAKVLKDSSSEIFAVHRQAADGDLITFARGGTDAGGISYSGGYLDVNGQVNGVTVSSGGTERMRITNAGNVGIGELNPAEELHISAAVPTLRLQDSDGTNQYLNIYESGGGANYLARNNTSYGTHNFYGFDGTTSTSFIGITVDAINQNASSAWYIRNRVNGGSLNLGVETSAGSLYYPVQMNGTSDILVFNNAEGEMARFTTDGRLGIGTTAPTANLEISAATSRKLDVVDTTGARVRLSTASGQTYVGSTTAHPLNIITNDAIRATIDSSGNVGIGATSLSNKLTVNGDQVLLANGELKFADATNNQVSTIRNSGGTSTSQLEFLTASTERMRIDSSGNLLIGKSAAALSNAGVRIQNYSGTQGVVYISKTVSGNVNALANYHNGTYVGGINYSDTATSFPTSSDQRLKENIVDAPSASDDIDAIQVRSFDWKADGSHQKYGMVAQELQTVAPEAVTGNADSEDMMGVDYSKLVPMLVKEIQSLRARVAQLEND